MSDFYSKYDDFNPRNPSQNHPKSKFESAFGSFGRQDALPMMDKKPPLEQNISNQFSRNPVGNIYGSRSHNAPTVPTVPSEEAFLHDSLNIPNGRVFKNGASLLKPVKAFDKYDMDAIHVDTDNVDGNVREINGRLYAKGENPIIEYTPTEQVIQPNGHITSQVKNHDADELLNSLKQQQTNNSLKTSESSPLTNMLPAILVGSLAAAAVGALRHSPMLLLGSIAIGGASLWFANENAKAENLQKDTAFRNRFDKQ